MSRFAFPPGGSASPLTTKGDLWGYSTLDARLPVGTDKYILTADSTQSLGVGWKLQQYAYYIYNSTATASGSTFNSWSSLITEINNQGNPPTVIQLTNASGETLPSGTYNLDNVYIYGNGVSIFGSGPVSYFANGFVASSWKSGGLGNGATIASLSSSSIVTVTTSQSFTLLGTSTIAVAPGSAPIFDISTGSTVTIYVKDGSQLFTAGGVYAPIFKVNHASADLILSGSGSNSSADVNVATGTLGKVERNIEADCANAFITNTDAGFSGTKKTDRYAVAQNIKGAFNLRMKINASMGSSTSYGCDVEDGVIITAMSANTTVSAPTQTKYDGMLGYYQFYDDGTARTITWPATIINKTAILPATTTVGQWTSCVVRWNAADAKWHCIYSAVHTTEFPDTIDAVALKIGGITVPTISSTDTLTNKRITPRVGTVASSATPTINTDNVDVYTITAQAAAITSFTTNLSGTPTDGQRLHIAITDDGTGRAITWGASFEASTVALPTTTVASTRLDVDFIWNTATSKWRCIGVA